MDSRSWGLNVIRATRADPPGRAGLEPERRATYGAALQQFDELLEAAAVAGHASRPLPLFYALSQAGRALAAAHCESWVVRAHGISEDRSISAEKNPLLRRIKRRVGAGDALSAVCEALRAPDPFGSAGEPIEVGAAWAALPMFNRFLPGWEERWHPAMRAFNDAPGNPPQHVMSLQVTTRAPQPRDALPSSGYPSLPAGFSFEPAAHPELPMNDSARRFGTVRWGPPESTPSVFDLTYSPSGTFNRWLLPGAPGSDEPFVPLTAWWVLLFGLSVFARYDPGLWSSSLNLDGSECAVPLRLLLDEALEAISELVADALIANDTSEG
ncbi:MAG TPA: hypothetical protein VNV42_16240 [Solirubrobacteraceae bacterium]|nr:hypothetical protein [Solirubrobacteraceae bacterium]